MNQDIYNKLRDRIIYLEYEPGRILKEQELAKEFGVSRTPLRTVLFRLEWEHLVKILPRTGILVMELELNTITNVFEARLELEAVIGSMAAERFTKLHFNRLDELIIECDRQFDHKNPRSLADLDMGVKLLFHEAAGNPFLTEMSDRLYSLTFRLWYFNMLKMHNKEWNIEVVSIKEDLLSLCELLKANIPKKVGEARKEHLLKHLKRIRSKFLGLSDTP
ncbi:MAG: GntR family transcriptional regulator [Desulfobacula sp.]|uniref:GntR family transcriptional regulator n=1 Tax=Desulfobacula sp. TaxID=2593537 RepID=UPI0025BA6B70|nr:GntR family transcriptional regulator [Desulfobacula sp.]MCD4722936.1 GntR family transcriptional regulator [Desulfobacula sp.]